MESTTSRNVYPTAPGGMVGNSSAMNSNVSTAAGLSKTTCDLLAASNMRPPAEWSSDIR
jgi:hypothetical protein